MVNIFLRLFFFVCFVDSSFQHVYSVQKPYFENYDDSIVSPCQFRYCLTLPTIINRVKSKSFRTQTSLIKLYQYGQYVKSSIGRLLPHFNFGIALGGAIRDPSILFSMGGFILPSNWYKWKESRLHYLAQRYSMINLLANQVRFGELLYYNLHREITASHIYTHYFKILDCLLIYMKKQNQAKISEGDIAIVEALRSDMSATALFINDTVADLLPKLGLELALSTDKEWDQLMIERIPLPDLMETLALDPKKHMEKVWASSDSMKSLFYMIEASNYNLKSRYFEWMSPFSDPELALGLSLKAQIKISKKEGDLLKIKYEEEKSAVKYSAYSAFGVHNTAIRGYIESMKGREAVKKVMDYVIDHMVSQQKVQIHHLYEGILLAVEFDLLRNFAQHLYLLTTSQIRRLLKSGKYYKGLEDDLPRYNKKDSRGFLLRLENHRIKRQLALGKLKLLPEDEKLFYYKT